MRLFLNIIKNTKNISPKIAPKIWRTITPNPSEKYKDYPRYRLYINDFNVSFDVGTHKGFGKYNAEKENINIKILPLFFSEFEKYLHVHFEPVNRSSISPIIFNIPISTANMSPQKWEVTNGNIKEFTNQLHSLEQQSIDAEKEENLNTIQEVIKKDEVIESTIGEISNEKMKLRKDDQLIVEVNSEELEKIEEEKISEISFKTNIKNYKWLKEEENTFNLIPEE